MILNSLRIGSGDQVIVLMEIARVPLPAMTLGE